MSKIDNIQDPAPLNGKEFNKDGLNEGTWIKGALIKGNPRNRKNKDEAQPPKQQPPSQPPQARNPLEEFISSEDDEKDYKYEDPDDDTPAEPFEESSDESSDEEDVVVNPDPQSLLPKIYAVPPGCSQKLAPKQPSQKATAVTQSTFKKLAHTLLFLRLYEKTSKEQTLQAIVHDLCKVVHKSIGDRIKKIAEDHKDNIAEAVTMIWTDEK